MSHSSHSNPVEPPFPGAGSPGPTPLITVLLAGKHTLLLDGLCRLLDEEDDIRVVATLDPSDQAPPVSPESVDVVVLSGDFDHLAEAAATSLRCPDSRARTVFADASDASHRALEALGLGIAAYLPRRATPLELKSAVRAIATHSDRVIISIPRDGLRRIDNQRNNIQIPQLEIEILSMVAAALTNGQIANRLSVSEAVVKRHLRNVFRRLGAVSRLDAVNKAHEARILPAQRSEPAPLRHIPKRSPRRTHGPLVLTER
ncbi:LuxR C-terminal-related transcriptional regulator [Kitasatospora griseola]|uniref:LuxR C-terminal-related transcriptional regulator n=1 Tax=Kitasatospora griseola TaxID=2064 RepID=UPI00380640A5